MPPANPIQSLISALEELDQQVGRDPSLLDEPAQLEQIIDAARPVFVKLCDPAPSRLPSPLDGHQDRSIMLGWKRERGGLRCECHLGTDGQLYDYCPSITAVSHLRYQAAIDHFGFAWLVLGLAKAIRRKAGKKVADNRLVTAAVREICAIPLGVVTD